MDIEAHAVSEVSSTIANCPHLKAYIATNDKTPFTDGYIDLYSGLRQNKEQWTGRVPIQVKGRTFGSRRGQVPKHPIARADLLAYQKDAGVLYFVVFIDPETNVRTPYYALLSPFAIESILNGVPPDQRRVSVTLKKWPTEPSAIERIVTLALRTRDQNVALGFDPVLFEHAESFTVHTASSLDLEAPVTLTPGATDFALVLNTSDGLSVPLSGELRIFPQDYLARSVAMQVGSGAVTYEGATTRRIDQESFEAKISEGLKLTFRSEPGRQSTNVSLTLERTLAGRLKTLEFYTALLDTQAIAFNGKVLPFEVTNSQEDPWLRKHLDELRAIAELCDHLGVDTHLIDVDQIDEAQARQLKVLHRAFVQDMEITDASAKSARVLQRLGQWNVMFLITPGNAPDKWRVVDPFSAGTRQQFIWRAGEGETGETIPVTAYDVVEEDCLGSILNMRLDSIANAYEAIADFSSTFNLANQRVLALITAADATAARRGDLLKAAEVLNDWLIREQGNEPHHLINRWQISWRRGPLSAEQRSGIRELKRDLTRSGTDNADQAEVACALLLGDEEEIDYLLRQLPEERLDQLKKWPIWRLRDSPTEANVPAVEGSNEHQGPA